MRSRKPVVVGIAVVLVVLAGVVVAVAVTRGGDSSSSTSASVTTATSAPVTTGTTTRPTTPTSTPTTPRPTVSTAPPTSTATTACGTVGDQQPKLDSFPNRLSPLFGKDIRTGDNGCFDRVVIELQGTGDFPGWLVQYPTSPLTMGESENPVVIAGGAVLEVRVQSWMTTMEGQGYTGPTDITPTNVTTIKQLKLIENFEGTMGWAVGLDTKRNFAVSVLSGPPRLVIDIQK